MHFEIYKSGTEYRWRLKASNGRIIADSGESYKNKSDCVAGIDLVKSTDNNTPVKDLT
jgi:uncharacterized protein YegP (UPF0339 family)